MPLATDIAQRAREIIYDPATWTSTASARDESAAAVSPLSPQATKFCGLGALVRAAHELGYSERWLVDIFGASPLGDLVRSNHLGHAEVLSNLAKLGSEASGSGTTRSGVERNKRQVRSVLSEPPMPSPLDPGNPDVRPPFWRHRYYYLALKIGVLLLAVVLALRLLRIW